MDKARSHVFPQPVLNHAILNLAHSDTHSDLEENIEDILVPKEGIVDKTEEEAEQVNSKVKYIEAVKEDFRESDERL